MSWTGQCPGLPMEKSVSMQTILNETSRRHLNSQSAAVGIGAMAFKAPLDADMVLEICSNVGTVEVQASEDAAKVEASEQDFSPRRLRSSMHIDMKQMETRKAIAS